MFIMQRPTKTELLDEEGSEHVTKEGRRSGKRDFGCPYSLPKCLSNE